MPGTPTVHGHLVKEEEIVVLMSDVEAEDGERRWLCYIYIYAALCIDT